MTIGLLTQSLSRNGGGMFDAVRGIARALSCLPDLDVRVFGLRDPNTDADLPAWEPLSPTAGRVRGPSAFGYSPELASALRASSPDLLHSHGIWMYPSLAAFRWSRRLRRPYLVSPHGMLDPWALRHSAWKKRLAALCYENACLARAACLHALCEAELRSIRAFGLRNPVCVIPNGVHVPDAPAPPVPEWRSQVPEGAKVILYLGRLHPKKGLPNLLRAWRTVSPDGWVLALAGWNQQGHEAHLRALSREFGLDGSVRFIGPQFGPAKWAAYRHADALVLPSLSEGLPVTVLEAWACGLPVLMTAECNLPEGFASKAALEIPSAPDGIAAVLADFVRLGDSERRQLGAAGRALVQQRFAWPAAAVGMRAVYTWLLGAGPPPVCVTLN